MAVPAVTLRLKRFRRQFGIMAPRVVVRSHLPWYWLLLPGLLLVMLVAAGGWLAAQRNEVGTAAREVVLLREQLAAQREELSILRSTAGTGKNEAAIERAAQQQLLGKVEALEAENSALRLDMLTFERLIPSVSERGGLRVEGFRVVRESDGRFRYRLLIAFQSDNKPGAFHGRLQLLVSYREAGVMQQRLLPGGGDSAVAYQLEVKRFLRKEGVFLLPAGAQLHGLEARILVGDTLKMKRVAQIQEE